MSAYLDTITDEYGRPVEGATVYVYDASGDLVSLTDGTDPIPNPVLTDETGLVSFTADDSVYLIEVHYLGRLQWKGSILVGASGDAVAAAAQAVSAAASASADAVAAAADRAAADASAADAAASAEAAAQIGLGVASTDALAEGSTNLYFTAARVRSTALTGLADTAGTPADTDSILTALGKVKKGFFTDHAGAGGSVHAAVIAGGANGFMTGADKTKLDGIANGATANSSDATLKSRANHTGTQASSTITLADGPKLLGRLTAGAGAAEELDLSAVRAAMAPNVQTVTSAGTVTPVATDDGVVITAQAVPLTLANPSGTANDLWGMAIRIKDNGTARAITFGSQYRAVGVTLPTTTVAGKVLYLGAIWNSAATKWDVVATRQEA